MVLSLNVSRCCLAKRLALNSMASASDRALTLATLALYAAIALAALACFLAALLPNNPPITHAAPCIPNANPNVIMTPPRLY